MYSEQIKYFTILFFSNPHLFFKKVIHKIKYTINIYKGIIYSFFSINGKAVNPRDIYFGLTNRCNLRCPMCGQLGENGFNKEMNPSLLRDNELSLLELKKIIDDVYRFKPTISIWGGEPFVRRDLFEFINHIKNKNLLCYIVTNGTFLKENAEELVNTSIDYLYVSIDGPQKIHDSIRGEGTFDKVIEGIKSIQEIKKKLNTKKPQIQICSVILETTYLYLEEIIKIGSELNVDFIGFVYAWSIQEKVGLNHSNLFKKLFNCESNSWKGFIDKNNNTIKFDELSKIINNINQIRNKNNKMKILFLPDLKPDDIIRYYNDPNFSLNKKKCYSPWIKADIKPNGNVTFCLDYPDYIIGNIREDSFRSIWNNEKARTFRKILKKFNKFPICTRCCQFYLT